jgi:cold shock CspA family protein
MAVAVMTLALTLTCAAASRLPHHLRFQSEAFVQHKGIHGNTPLVVCQDGHCFVPDPVRASLQKWVATATVVSGVCKWFDQTRGYGFIVTREDQPRDLFVHQSDLCKAGVCVALSSGERLEFRIAKSVQDGREKAMHITGPDSEDLLAAARLMPSHTDAPHDDDWSHLFDEVLRGDFHA